MANALKDENGVSTLIAALNTNGSTIVRVKANASNSNSLQISDGTGGTDHGPSVALHDENMVPTLLAVSSDDGVTPVVVYADSSGRLLTQST